MPPTATRRRRLIGMLFLGFALLLAVAGQTVLRPHLDGLLFLAYWLACLVTLGLAVATALLDILLLRHEARREHLELLRETLERPAPDKPNPGDQSASTPPSAHRKLTHPNDRAGPGRTAP